MVGTKQLIVITPSNSRNQATPCLSDSRNFGARPFPERRYSRYSLPKQAFFNLREKCAEPLFCTLHFRFVKLNLSL